MDYLTPGPQTPISDIVKYHANQASKQPIFIEDEFLQATYRTCAYIEHLLETNQKDISVPMFRSLDSVLEEGISVHCSDIGVVFRGLMMAQGYATAYVETVHPEMVLGKSRTAHVLGKVMVDRPFYVDPRGDAYSDRPGPVIIYGEEALFPFMVLAEGLDSWHLGIRTLDDLDDMVRKSRLGLLYQYERLLDEHHMQPNTLCPHGEMTFGQHRKLIHSIFSDDNALEVLRRGAF